MVNVYYLFRKVKIIDLFQFSCNKYENVQSRIIVFTFKTKTIKITSYHFVFFLTKTLLA